MGYYSQADLDQAVKAALDAAKLEDKQRVEGLRRLEQYEKEGIILGTQGNADQIGNYLASNGLLISAKTVDAAIQALSDSLERPEEVPVFLGDGTRQLPIDTVPNHQFSVAQLADLDKRQRALKGRGDWHGAAF
jgi:hypothetical protein